MCMRLSMERALDVQAIVKELSSPPEVVFERHLTVRKELFKKVSRPVYQFLHLSDYSDNQFPNSEDRSNDSKGDEDTCPCRRIDLVPHRHRQHEL